jgi:hypothetical protein
MWTPPVLILLITCAVQQITITFTFDSLLFVLLENLQLRYDSVIVALSIATVILGILALCVAPIIDAYNSLKMVLGASVVSIVLRCGLFGTLVFLHHLTPIAQQTLVSIFVLGIFTCDLIFVSQTNSLLLKRFIDNTFATSPSVQEHESTRVFAAQYCIENLAAFMGALCYDTLRAYAPTVEDGNIAAHGLAVMCNMAVIFITFLNIAFFSPWLAYPPVLSLSTSTPPTTTSCRSRFSWFHDMYNVLKQQTFRRYAVFSLVLLGVSTIYRHIDQTLPIVLQRLYTPRVHFALIEGINALGVALLGVPIQWWTANYDSYNVIMTGTFISSVSVLIAVIPGTHATGQEAVFLNYIPYALFVALYSVGEATWSGRLRSYLLQTAPKHSRASYQALAQLLQIGARLIAAWHATWLIGHYCPSNTSCAPQLMWTIIWALGAITPIVLFFFGRWLRMPTRKQLDTTTQQLLVPDTTDTSQGLE